MDLYVDDMTETLLFIDPNEMRIFMRMSEKKIDVIRAIIMTNFFFAKKR